MLPRILRSHVARAFHRTAMASTGGEGALKRAGITKDPKNVTPEEWKKIMGEEAYAVTREAATEAPFTGKYDKTMKDGQYNCFCCGAPLFDSDTKFNSGCGWPAFFAAKKEGDEEEANIQRLADNSHGMTRVEVRCKKCDAHLGHVFEDGPKPTGERFCINSCAIDFEPKAKQ